MLAALDAGADDVDTSSQEEITIVCPPDKLEPVKMAMTNKQYKVSQADVVMSPSSTVEISDAQTGKQLLKLLEMLEDHDDVQRVFANFEMDPKLMDELIASG